MPSNVATNAGSGGADIVTKQISHDGDTAQIQGIFVMGISGTEDSYTAAAINGDASNGLDVDVTRSALPTGASTAANQSSGNALLTTIDADTGTLVTSNAAIQAAVEGTLTVDGSGVTQPVSHAALTELAGAINASAQMDVNIAAQDAAVTVDLGANNDVTVQGEDAENAPVTASPVQVGGRYDAIPRTLGDGDVGAIALDADGAVQISDGGNTITVDGTITANAGTDLNTSALALESGGNLAAAVTALQIIDDWDETNRAAVNLIASQAGITGGAGAVGANTPRVTLASDDPAVALLTTMDADTGGILTSAQALDNVIVVDDAAFTPGTTSVSMVGFTADETSTDSVDEGDAGAARMTLDRKQITTPYAHAAAGGATPYRNVDVDETEDDIKTSAGKLFWLNVMNLTASVLYLQIYDNVSASVTVGTTTPTLTIPIVTLGDTNGAGVQMYFGDLGLQFNTGICIACTTTFGGSSGPAANGCFVNGGYL